MTGTEEVWVADAYNHRLQKFSRNGKSIVTLGRQGSGPGQLNVPVSLAVGPNDILHVADSENHRLVALTEDAEELATLVIPGGFGNGLNTPAHIAWGPNGNLYVADPAHRRVLLVRWKN